MGQAATAADVAPPIPELWKQARDAFIAARDAENVYDRSFWTPSDDGGVIDQAVSAEMERLTVARCDAEDKLIAAPAPDLEAVTWKITYARERWREFDDWPATWWYAVLADMRRLSGGLA